MAQESQPRGHGADLTVKMDGIMARLDKLDLLDKLTTDVNDLKNSLEFCHESVREVKAEHQGLKDEVKSLTEKINLLKTQTQKDHETILEQQWRTMRDNLLFHGIAETDGGTETDGEPENTEAVLKEFIQMLGLDSDRMEFDRVHRMGRAREGKPRSIVAKFVKFKEREAVRQAAFKLAGKKFGISEQLPMEWVEKRKSLLPKKREAKAKGLKTKFVRDKLIVNGQVVNGQVGGEPTNGGASNMEQ